MLLLIAIADYRSLLAHSLAIRDIGDNLRGQFAGQFYLLTQPLLNLHTNIDPDIAVTHQRCRYRLWCYSRCMRSASC